MATNPRHKELAAHGWTPHRSGHFVHAKHPNSKLELAGQGGYLHFDHSGPVRRLIGHSRQKVPLVDHLAALAANTIVITAIPAQTAGQPFTVSGTSQAPIIPASAMSYKVDSGAVTAFPTGSTVPGAFTPPKAAWGPLTIPALAVGTHSITVSDASGGSASASVTVQAVTGPVVSPPGTIVQNNSTAALLYATGDSFMCTGGVIIKNGSADTRTKNVVSIGTDGTSLFQVNSAGNYYSISVVKGQAGTWSGGSATPIGPYVGVPPPPPPPPPPPANGTLAVSGGQIVDSTGAPFVFRGLSVLDDEMGKTPPSGIKALIPQTNAIMLAIGADGGGYQSAQSNSAIVAYVQAANALGMWVGLSDYVPGQPNVRSGQDLTNSFNWYGSLAKATAGLNVFWTTENEVGGTLDQSFQGIYNAIRGAGNSGLIFFETQYGNPGTGGMSASTFAQMTGVGFNVHAYPWAYGGSSQAAFDADALNFINQLKNFAKSADGVMPVIMGEGGNASDGNNIDDTTINGKFATVQATLDMNGRNPGYSGALMWLHDWQGIGGDADEIVVNGALSQYGQQIAAGL